MFLINFPEQIFPAIWGTEVAISVISFFSLHELFCLHDYLIAPNLSLYSCVQGCSTWFWSLGCFSNNINLGLLWSYPPFLGRLHCMIEDVQTEETCIIQKLLSHLNDIFTKESLSKKCNRLIIIIFI